MLIANGVSRNSIISDSDTVTAAKRNNLAHCDHSYNICALTRYYPFRPYITISTAKGFGKRHGQAFLWLIGYAIFFAMKTNMAVGIVAMIDNTENPAFIVSIMRKGKKEIDLMVLARI